MTFFEKSALASHRPSGFDLLRVALATSVVCFHTIIVTYGSGFERQVWLSHWRIVVGPTVPAFFVLSGYLVCGSFEKQKTLASFLYLRCLRIFPSLLVAVLFATLLIGPLMTRMSLAAYFHDSALYFYFFNVVGNIHHNILPGVFVDNPLPGTVNLQLWTVKFELLCYVMMALLASLGITGSRASMAAVWVLLQILALVAFVLHGPSADTAPSESLTILYFFTGVMFFKLRDRIVASRWICVIAVLCIAGLVSLGHGYYLSAVPIAYVTIYLGHTNVRKPRILKETDFSYGIYLYGFPVQQAVVAAGVVPLDPWINLGVALPLIYLAAGCSWHFWEKPLSGLKVYRKKIDALCYFLTPGVLKRVLLPAVLPGANRSV